MVSMVMIFTLNFVLLITEHAFKMLKLKHGDGNKSETGTENDRSERTKFSCWIVRIFRTDSVYRKKIVLTLAVFLSYVSLGWVVLQIGTALPDLQILVDVDLDTASWLFTTWSLGFVTGSLFCGFLYDRVNRLVIMFICTFGVGICSLFLPHSKSFSIMIVLRIACGIFSGGIDTGANTIVPTIWGEKAGPYMQALYLSYTVGSIVVPFATEPFMSSGHHALNTDSQIAKTNSENTTNVFNISNCTNVTCEHEIDTPRRPVSSSQNSSYYYTFESVFDKNISNISLVSNISNISADDIQIHNAFTMTCVLVLFSSLPYLVMVLMGDFDVKASIKTSKDTNTEKEVEPLREKNEVIVVIETGTRTIQGKRKIFVIACIAGVNLLYGATEDSLGDFLVTFALDFLHWDNSTAVTLISLYWVASCIGGLAGVFLVRCLKTTKLLFIAHLFWIATFLLSLIASLYRINVMIWIFIPSSGFFMVLIIPAAISWTEENVCHITGRISSIFMIATGAGLAANPRFLGYMMETHGYISFLCILFIESVICLGFYVLAFTFRYFRNKSDDDFKATLRK